MGKAPGTGGLPWVTGLLDSPGMGSVLGLDEEDASPGDGIISEGEGEEAVSDADRLSFGDAVIDADGAWLGVLDGCGVQALKLITAQAVLTKAAVFFTDMLIMAS